MGYNAYVKCNCFSEGKLKTSPPYPELIDEDDEGVWCISGETNDQKKLEENETWIQNQPCEHEDFKFINLRLSNNSGMNGFRDALRTVDPLTIKTISEYLPGPAGNCGKVPAPSAQKFLNEIRALKNATGIETYYFTHGFEQIEQKREFVFGSQFVWLLDKLIELSQASIKTGNPIIFN